VGKNRDGTPERPASGYLSMHPQTRLGYAILPYLRSKFRVLAERADSDVYRVKKLARFDA